MTKKKMLEHWGALPSNLPILPHFTAIPYKARGSRYGTCGIRIDGNPSFVNAVLSRLKDLIDGENGETRLDCSLNEVDGSKLGKNFCNKDVDAQCCYIRLAERGREAKIMNAILGGRKAAVDLDDDYLE